MEEDRGTGGAGKRRETWEGAREGRGSRDEEREAKEREIDGDKVERNNALFKFQFYRTLQQQQPPNVQSSRSGRGAAPPTDWTRPGNCAEKAAGRLIRLVTADNNRERQR